MNLNTQLRIAQLFGEMERAETVEEAHATLAQILGLMAIQVSPDAEVIRATTGAYPQPTTARLVAMLHRQSWEFNPACLWPPT